jgi:ribosome modulation factor
MTLRRHDAAYLAKDWWYLICGTNWAFNHFERMAKENTARKMIEPYDRGVIAARTGMSKDSNPYRPGTNEFSDWLAGFEAYVDADDAVEINNQ